MSGMASCEKHRTTVGSQLSSSIMWVPETKLKSSGWAADTLTQWAILLAHLVSFNIYIFLKTKVT